MKLVVHASVAIKWMIEESDSAAAAGLLSEDHEFVAPELIVAEVISAAWKQRRRGDIGDDQYDEIANRITRGPIECRPLRPLAPRAAMLARELDHPIYDCFYLALSEAESAPLITADRRLVATCSGTPFASQVRALR